MVLACPSCKLGFHTGWTQFELYSCIKGQPVDWFQYRLFVLISTSSIYNIRAPIKRWTLPRRIFCSYMQGSQGSAKRQGNWVFSSLCYIRNTRTRNTGRSYELFRVNVFELFFTPFKITNLIYYSLKNKTIITSIPVKVLLYRHTIITYKTSKKVFYLKKCYINLLIMVSEKCQWFRERSGNFHDKISRRITWETDKE